RPPHTHPSTPTRRSSDLCPAPLRSGDSSWPGLLPAGPPAAPPSLPQSTSEVGTATPDSRTGRWGPRLRPKLPAHPGTARSSTGRRRTPSPSTPRTGGHPDASRTRSPPPHPPRRRRGDTPLRSEPLSDPTWPPTRPDPVFTIPAPQPGIPPQQSAVAVIEGRLTDIRLVLLMRLLTASVGPF